MTIADTAIAAHAERLDRIRAYTRDAFAVLSERLSKKGYTCSIIANTQPLPAYEESRIQVLLIGLSCSPPPNHGTAETVRELGMFALFDNDGTLSGFSCNLSRRKGGVYEREIVPSIHQAHTVTSDRDVAIIVDAFRDRITWDDYHPPR